MPYFYGFENSGIFDVPNWILWDNGTKIFKNLPNQEEWQTYTFLTILYHAMW